MQLNAVEKWWRRIAEPLLEDEALRGDLADDAFQPLLDWAIAAARRCAAAAAGAPEPAAYADVCIRQLRLLLRSATRAAGDGRRDELVALVGPPVFTPAAASAALARLATIPLADRPVDNARQLAAALTLPAKEEPT